MKKCQGCVYLGSKYHATEGIQEKYVVYTKYHVTPYISVLAEAFRTPPPPKRYAAADTILGTNNDKPNPKQKEEKNRHF